MHNFLPEQPDLNYWNPEVQAAILAAACFWLDRGVDGFRLDVINYLFQDRALTDNPVADYRRTPVLPTRFQLHVHDRTRPETLAFLSRIRALLDCYPARMSVGEVVDDPPLPRQIEYTAGNDRLHTAYSFHLLSAQAAGPDLFRDAIRSWQGADGWPSWSLGNHDVARVASRLAQDDPAHARVLLAALMCLPGTIFLYQGEELGLPQAEVPFDRLQDPFAISAWTGGAGRDGARTPMPWTVSGVSAGFSAAARTWLPLDERHRSLAVDAQESDESSMLTFTRRLVALRGAEVTLRLGRTALAEASDGVLAFVREHEGERLACAFELSGREATWRAPNAAEILFRVNGGGGMDHGQVSLPPFGGVVIRLTV
jgi:alpha-glucosidase